jgi:hypothetical protein
VSARQRIEMRARSRSVRRQAGSRSRLIVTQLGAPRLSRRRARLGLCLQATASGPVAKLSSRPRTAYFNVRYAPGGDQILIHEEDVPGSGRLAEAPRALPCGESRASSRLAKNRRACGRHPGPTQALPPGVSSMIGGHTTVLHSLRRMENRASKDPELRAYMASVRQMFPSHRPSTGH